MLINYQLEHHHHFLGTQQQTHTLGTICSLDIYLRTFSREHIIVHIRKHLGNLKKTYLGDPRLPKFEVRLPMFECADV